MNRDPVPGKQLIDIDSGTARAGNPSLRRQTVAGFRSRRVTNGAHMRTLLLRPRTWIGLAVGLVLAAVALALFQPWKLWLDTTVNEPPPAAAAAAPSAATAAVDRKPATLAHGAFISHEHSTTGTARLLQLPDGSRLLRLEDLDTSNGPLLKVWLSDAPVRDGATGWRIFDASTHLDLGPLKGNKGSQNYTVPAGVDLSRYRSVTIWCARFHVSFGAAPLTA
jgi:Electron transfer DM13